MDTLTVKMQTIDEKVMFSATSRENPEVVIDYFPPVGTGSGYTSLELLLASFGSCVGTGLLTLLRFRMKKSISGMSVAVTGTVREEHPKAIQHIVLKLKIKAKDLSEPEVRGALQVAENEICPVWAMVKGNVTVETEIEIDNT